MRFHFIIATLVLGLGGCVFKDGGATKVSSTGPEHCGLITADEVWAADLNPHIVTCDVFLEGGTLTIGAGTEVLFESDVGLWVSEDDGRANLDVAGTLSEPVSFRHTSGSAPGLWRGIGVHRAAGDVVLSHLTIDGGGGFNSVAALLVEHTDITVDHLTVTNSEDLGLSFRYASGLSEDSTALVVSGSDGYPVRIDPPRADTLPAEESDYTGNAIDAIAVHPSGTDYERMDRSALWEDLGVSYVAEQGLYVDGRTGAPAILTLEPNVHVEFTRTSGLHLSNRDGASGLVAVGTPDAPVVLTSADATDVGAWSGLFIHDNALDSEVLLDHVEITWGGGFNSEAAVTLTSASPTIRNTLIAGSECWGMQMWRDSAPVMENVTFEGNECGDVAP